MRYSMQIAGRCVRVASQEMLVLSRSNIVVVAVAAAVVVVVVEEEVVVVVLEHLHTRCSVSSGKAM